jgi:HEPN domain-containing protein
MDMKKTQQSQARGWLESAANLRQQAEKLKTYAPAESVAASQRCIELSLKSMFALLGVEFDKTHVIKQEDFNQLMQAFQAEGEEMRRASSHLPRLLLLGQFWAKFRSVAEYGFETLGVPQGRLFKESESELALKHAGECYSFVAEFFCRDHPYP